MPWALPIKAENLTDEFYFTISWDITILKWIFNASQVIKWKEQPFSYDLEMIKLRGEGTSQQREWNICHTTSQWIHEWQESQLAFLLMEDIPVTKDPGKRPDQPQGSQMDREWGITRLPLFNPVGWWGVREL